MKLSTQQIEKLKDERAENEAKIEQLTHQNERLKAREQYLMKKERDGRTHRLCVTGGIVESILPEIRTLTQSKQYDLMERVLHLPEAEHIIKKVLADHARKERKAGRAVGTVSSEC